MPKRENKKNLFSFTFRASHLVGDLIRTGRSSDKLEPCYRHDTVGQWIGVVCRQPTSVSETDRLEDFIRFTNKTS